MTTKNKYYFRSRIKEAKFRKLVRCYALDFTATKAAQLTRISVRSVNTIYLKIRQRIKENNEILYQNATGEYLDMHSGLTKISVMTSPSIENNTSLLGAYGILKRQNDIFTAVLPPQVESAIKLLEAGNDTSKEGVIKQLELSGYEALIGVYPGMRMKLYRLHSADNNRAHTNEDDTESFWVYTKQRLAKFNGIPMQTFFLHLKETEFRFNHRYDDLYDELLKILRANPL